MKTAHECWELFDIKSLTSYDVWIKAIQAVQLNAMAEQRRLDSAICDKWRDKMDAATANSIKAEILGDL